MASDKAVNEWDKLQSQVRSRRAMDADLLGTLSFGMLLLGFVVVRDITEIIPLEVRRPYETGSNYANKDYLLDTAGYALGMMLTITPGTVDYNNKVILKMADSDGYTGLKTALDAAATRLRQERATTIQVPHKEEVSEQDKRVKVSGELKIFIANELTSEHERSYLVEFTITTSGRFYVSGIEEIVRRDPSVSRPADS